MDRLLIWWKVGHDPRARQWLRRHLPRVERAIHLYISAVVTRAAMSRLPLWVRLELNTSPGHDCERILRGRQRAARIPLPF